MGEADASGQSSSYEQLRARLRAAEVALADERARVAAMRQQVPAGPELPDYVLRGVPGGENVRLTELFDHRDALVVYHLVLEPDGDCCPSCSMWLDALNGATDQVMDNAGFAVVSRANPNQLALWALRRGWDQLRVLSSEASSFDRDLGVETPDGAGTLGVSVLVRDAAAQVRLFYVVKAVMEDAGWRHNDLFSPMWQALDLLPGGQEPSARRNLRGRR
jgi:predicted dithiol-disulfide oxidoreductase (DUF899 family)